MTQEGKALLTIALCEYLPHNVKVTFNENELPHTLVGFDTEKGMLRIERNNIYSHINFEHCKLYLRPLSSMTNDEIYEFVQICDTVLWLGDKRSTCILSLEQTYWLNAHHFDYRGLIPLCLAIEAPEEMYKTNK